MRKLMLFVVTVLFAASAYAADEMRKLDFLVGEWKGEASMQMGPGQPQRALQHERVQSKLSGKALLIEGLGKRRLEDGTAGEVVHDALAVISWDDAKKKYRIDTWTERGGYIEGWLEAEEKKAVWGFDVPHGKMRFTIWLGEKGEWRETGEFSRDGKEWMPILEMTLTKK